MSKGRWAHLVKKWACANCGGIGGVNVMDCFELATVTGGELWCDLCLLSNISAENSGYEPPPIEFLVEAA